MHFVDQIIHCVYKIWWCIECLSMGMKFGNSYNVWWCIDSFPIESSPVNETGLAGGEWWQLAWISYRYQRQIGVWLYIPGRPITVRSQPSLGLKDIDTHQLWSFSTITKCLPSSTRCAETHQLALLINTSFRDPGSSRLPSSTGDIRLGYWCKSFRLWEVLLDSVYDPYTHTHSWQVVHFKPTSWHCSSYLLHK